MERTYECPTCGDRMTGYTASLCDEERPAGTYADPCGHRIVVLGGPAGPIFKTAPDVDGLRYEP